MAGKVIPAHPLALTSNRKLDERHQRALSRYYLAAGAGGLAVGVHTTQFEIHRPEVGLYQPVLQIAMEEVQQHSEATQQPPVTVAGVVGKTDQAVKEATLASNLGYDCALLSLAAMREASNDQLINHVRAVAEVIPVFGFYLQPGLGGRVLDFEFWQQFVEVENVVAIKIATFNRYSTIDVVRAVAASGRADEIALYTGNDDNIFLDLITEFRFEAAETTRLRIVGGLLGHWAVWTRKAVEQLSMAHQVSHTGGAVSAELLTLNVQITDANAAIFDAQHEFAGCVPGIHEVLRRQGLMEGRWCLNPKEELSDGQGEEIDRVYKAYPHLNDDLFVREHLDQWLL